MQCRTCDAVVHVDGARPQLLQREWAKLGSIQQHDPLRRRHRRSAGGPARSVHNAQPGRHARPVERRGRIQRRSPRPRPHRLQQRALRHGGRAAARAAGARRSSHASCAVARAVAHATWVQQLARHWHAIAASAFCAVVAPGPALAARVIERPASSCEIYIVWRASVVRVEQSAGKLRVHQRREAGASGRGVAAAHAAGVVHCAAVRHAVAAGARAVRAVVAGQAAHAARVRHSAAVCNACTSDASAQHSTAPPAGVRAPYRCSPRSRPAASSARLPRHTAGQTGRGRRRRRPLCPADRYATSGCVLGGATAHDARAFVPPGTPEQSGQRALGWHTASTEPRAQAQRPHASRNLPLFGTPSQPAQVELSPPHTLHLSTSCVPHQPAAATRRAPRRRTEMPL